MLALPASLWAGGESWWSLLNSRKSHHPQMIQAQALLRAAEEALEDYRLSRWALPVGVSLQGKSTDAVPQISGALSLDLSFPLGESPAQEQKRRTLEDTVNLRRTELREVARKVTALGVQTYWDFQLSRQNLTLSREAVVLAAATVEKAKALWDLGQADLNLWSEAEEDLKKAEQALVKAEQTAGESRRSWYSCLGRPDREEEWTGTPHLKATLPEPWHYDWRTTGSWVKNSQTLDQALWALKTAETTTVPWNLGLTVQAPGDHNLTLGYAGVEKQGNLSIRGNVIPAESTSLNNFRITLEGSLKPDLLNLFREAGEQQQNYLAAEAASEAAARDLENQAKSTKAAWEASLATLNSTKAALQRALVQRNSLEAKAGLGQALAGDVETARLAWKKTQLALEEAELGVFTAAIAAGEHTDNLLNVHEEMTNE